MTGFEKYTRRNLSGNLISLSITLQLIIINVALFIAFFIWLGLSDGESISFIALQPLAILQGKYLWTFITSMFMHAGFFHLFANMFSLLFVGTLVERLIGKKRYLWLYLISGLFASLLFVGISYFTQSELETFAVGASGALFGLIGFLMIITPNLPVYIMFIPIPIKMKYAAPGILLLLWFISLIGDIPIGNTAHLGGLLAGLAYGMYIKMKYRRKSAMISRHFS
jgi:membrane associated rhomboid family serine protease